MPVLGGNQRSKREQIVRAHMETENRFEFDETLETFEHPRYELIATGEVYDGPEEVMAYFKEGRTAFPDQSNELLSLRHADDAVIVEFILRGTHDGPLRGLPPTGRSFETRMTAFFIFGDEKLVCERVYFNPGDILQQIGMGRDPTSLTGRLGLVASHPLRIGRGLIRRATGR